MRRLRWARTTSPAPPRATSRALSTPSGTSATTTASRASSCTTRVCRTRHRAPSSAPTRTRAASRRPSTPRTRRSSRGAGVARGAASVRQRPSVSMPRRAPRLGRPRAVALRHAGEVAPRRREARDRRVRAPPMLPAQTLALAHGLAPRAEEPQRVAVELGPDGLVQARRDGRGAPDRRRRALARDGAGAELAGDRGAHRSLRLTVLPRRRLPGAATKERKQWLVWALTPRRPADPWPRRLVLRDTAGTWSQQGLLASVLQAAS